MKRLVFGVFFFLSLSFLYGEQDTPKKTYEQWFTGPLFAPLAITPDPAHPGIEVTYGVTNTYGFYDSDWKLKNASDIWTLYNYVDFQAGFNPIVGIEFLGSWVSNFKEGRNSVRIQDTIFRLGFQILNTENNHTLIPNFRIIIQETFPTGNYQKLNPKKKGTDLTGLGSFQTGIFLSLQKLYHLSGKHKFETRFSLGYFVPSNVKVKGLNAYGGGTKTEGTVHPGHYITCYLSGEYNLNDRWALGFDANYQHNFSGNFLGEKGFTRNGLPAQITVPLMDQFTIAPELEHTFSENTGILLGIWFSVVGRNVPAFRSVFIAILHIF